VKRKGRDALRRLAGWLWVLLAFVGLAGIGMIWRGREADCPAWRRMGVVYLLLSTAALIGMLWDHGPSLAVGFSMALMLIPVTLAHSIWVQKHYAAAFWPAEKSMAREAPGAQTPPTEAAEPLNPPAPDAPKCGYEASQAARYQSARMIREAQTKRFKAALIREYQQRGLIPMQPLPPDRELFHSERPDE
jgi:hypothetical protein